MASADPHEFIARAKLLMERGAGYKRGVLRHEWETLQRQYMRDAWRWPWSVTNEIAELELKVRKFIQTRKK